MARYFHISAGLRGGYMPDNAAVIRCETRRELRQYIAQEARDYREAGFIGASERAISWLAAAAWKEAGKPSHSYFPHALPLAPSHARQNYCHGIFASAASRADWLEYQEQEQF